MEAKEIKEFQQFLNTEFPAKKHSAHATYTEMDMRKAFLFGKEMLRQKENLLDAPENDKLMSYQRLRISRDSRRLAGKVSRLTCAGTNGITLPTMREVLEDIYNRTDELVRTIDEIEEEIKGHKK